ncbi:hypothetical protein BUALT_Bualt12G0012300 [Buddleja alternifolia]|uniref:F-box domain-containing protein n=1 Tax=Buddleja alternifolia TaxID=168488 RepID=A0AAV6WP17_9LAMI|nr:hypothetical protein BUALT_Bualt12G0012300 [Buddleja alternifolia]
MAGERRSVISYGVPATSSVNGYNSRLIFKRAKLCENNPEFLEEEEEEDRLSALPDSLLLHILSFLRTKDVARTGFLSRRWKFLWTGLSEFDFRDYNQEIGKICGFINWIGKSLFICRGIYLKKFAVTFYYQDCFASSVNAWIQFVIRNKVEDVSLHLYSSNNNLYKLPQLMFSNSSFINLSLRNCIIAPPATMEWKSLKSLVIEEVELSQSVIGTTLSGCPVLESLKLKGCWGLRLLDINTRSLKELVIESWKDDSATSVLEIFAPYLRLLSITGYWRGTDCPTFRLIGIPSLVRANLVFDRYFSPSFLSEASVENVVNYVRALFGNLKDVKELVLGTWFVQVLSVLKMKGWQLPQYSCKCLTLDAFGHAQSVAGILYMLESSSNLETLVINVKFHPPHEARAAVFDLNCDLLQLKTVKIANIGGQPYPGEPMLKLVQLLLKRAKILEKMVVDVKEFMESSSTGNSSDYLKIAKTVLSYPRASPKAVVQLCY